MKKTQIIAALLLVSAALSATACIQRYGTTLTGDYIRYQSISGQDIVRRLNSLPRENWRAQEEALRPYVSQPGASVRTRSDYAAVLLHLGRIKEAIEILEPLAAEFPNEYPVIANLGTAYELDGQLEAALDFISRGIRINSNSHRGTEWVHVKILEAKIALKEHPTWLERNSVLGYSFGNGPLPTLPAALQPKEELDRVIQGIIYQLEERLQFVKPPDATVADLLFDLGNLKAASTVVESALPLYHESLRFSELRSGIIARRSKHFNQLSSRITPAKILRRIADHNWVPAAFGVAVAGVILTFVLVDRRRKHRSKTSGEAPINPPAQ